MHLEKNLNALAKRWPEYVEPIKNARDTGRYAVQPSAKPGSYNLLDRRTNTAYYNNIDPYHSAYQQINDMHIRMPHIGIFLGLGLGYHLDVYNKMYDAANLELVFEGDFELIKVAFTYINLVPLIQNQRVHFFFGNIVQNFYSNLFNLFRSGFNVVFLKALNIVHCDASIGANKDYYVSVIQVMKSAAANAFSIYGNDPDDSMIGIKNTLYNIDEIISNPGIKDLKGAFKGKPGIVVATGPSLMKNIDLLHEVKDKAVIVAADASMQIMKKHGLKPHMVTSLERTSETHWLFADLEEEDLEDVYFAACPVVHPVVYKNKFSERIMVYRHFATFKWLGIEKGTMDIGPSSGNMAFKLLEYMGCEPIILIGQDLAFDGDTTHAEGGHFGANQERYHKDRIVEVEGNYVPKIRTTSIWDSFRRFYEQDVSRFKGRVINATEGGAKINGTELMSFREAIDSVINKPFDTLGTIKKKLNKPFQAQQEKDRAQVLKKVDDVLEYTKTLKSKTKEAVELCLIYSAELGGRIEKGDYIEFPEYIDYMNAMEKFLEIYGAEKFHLTYMHYVQSYYIKMLSEANALKHSEAPSVVSGLKLSKLYSEMYINMYRLIETMEKEFVDLQELLTEKDMPWVQIWRRYWKMDKNGKYPWEEGYLPNTYVKGS